MNTAPSPPVGTSHTVVGRYAIFDEIASGGMATVHLGRLLGAAGFSRTVAIKRLHPQLARDQEFATMFVDEALLASRINHPNVVQTLDVVPEGKEILLVMEYVHGVPFSQLLGISRRSGWRVPARIVAGVMVGVLEGLHAAHEARNEVGLPLGVVHRDVSPQNVIIGVEGTARVIDFGVAKAMGKMHATRDGQLKGKLSYMSPEQVRGVDVTRLSDVFSAAVVLWEALMSERLFDGKNPAELIMQVLSLPIPTPRSKFPDLPEALDDLVMKGLAREPVERFATAREMAVALESAMGGVAPAREIAEWVEAMAGPALAERVKLLESIERAAAAPTSGERTRAEGIRAMLGPDIGDPFELGVDSGSGPKPRGAPIPIAGAMRADDRSSALPYDLTMPQKGRSEYPSAGAAPPSSADPSPPPVTPARSASIVTAAVAAAGSGDPETLPSALDSSSSPPRPRDMARSHRRTPIRAAEPDDSDRSALRERLGWPIRLVIAGVLISFADFGLRQADVPLPIRPIWIAEVLVVVGVIWAFITVVTPSGEE